MINKIIKFIKRLCCNHVYITRYKEVYEGDKHHTFKVYRCAKCDKTKQEQLQ